MKRLVLVCGLVMAFGFLAAACSLSSISGSDAGADGVVTPSCYLDVGANSCICYAENKDSQMSAASVKKVSGCNEASAGPLACNTNQTLDGTTDQCFCTIFKVTCNDQSAPCYCQVNQSSATDSQCTKSKYEWCCAATDHSHCYCGKGAFGSACANGEASVSTCAATDVKPASDTQPSCDGLKFKKK